MDATPRKARDVFLAAFKLPAEEQERYLQEACRDDQDLRQRVSALLQAQAEIGTFHEAPARTVDQPITESSGTVVGQYKLLQQIGEGGMGTVWMAQQTEPVKRVVALKLIKAGMDSKQIIARFEAERQALALMDHANIAKVLDAGATENGRPYFVMDLVKGVPITKYCDEHHLTPRQRLELFVPVCQAVQHAHQKGIIHRDLKPSNVLVALYDGKPVPKVIDFGVAKAAGQPLTEKTLVTGFGNIVGTLEYMSPEQAEINQLDIDTRSDIYSLGVLLYELLTGSPPFSRKELTQAGMVEMLRVIREQEPTKPSTKLSSSDALPTLSANRGTEPAKLTKLVRGELDWIVMKALEKDRSRRYETANGFAMDVQRYLADEAVLACPPSVGYRLGKFARRNKAGLTVAAVVLFFLVLLGSGVGWAVRDRSARQTKAAGQVESILTEVDRFEGEQKWPEALAAALRAEVAVAGGEADAATAQQVRELLKDLEFIGRLEQVRLQRATLVEGKFNIPGADEEYARAFHDFGVDVEELAVETSIDRLKARPALAIPLAAALDDWAAARQFVLDESKGDVAGWKRLVAIARGIDPEPLRDRLRSTWGQPASPEVLDDLRRLADSIDIRAQHPATLVRLAGTLHRVRQPDSALRILRDAQYAHPGDFWVNIELGHALSKLNDFEGAIRFNTAAVCIRPHSVAAHNNLGVALAGQKKLDEAIGCYKKAIELDPKHAFLHGNLGNALLDQNKPAEAIDSYEKAIKLGQRYASAYQGLGRALSDRAPSDQKNLPKAIDCYKKAIELDPKNPRSWGPLLLAVRDLRDQKKLDETIAWLRKVVELSPPVPEAYITLGGELLRQDKAAEGIAVYRQGLARLPNEAMLHFRLAHALWGQMRVEEAADSFRQAINLNKSGNVYYWYHDLARMYRQQKKPKEEIDNLRKAVDINPKYADAHFELGLALAALGQPAEAITCYRKAIQADPKHVVAHYALGHALVARKDFAGAASAFQEAATLYPNYALYWKSLGVALYRVGNLKAAVDALDKFRQLGPFYHMDSGGLFFLSMAHGRLNNKDKARAFFDQAAQWRMEVGSTDEELRRLCAEAAALLGLEVPPALKEPPVLTTPGPTLLKPAAGDILDNGTPNFSKSRVWEFDWSDVPGATRYHLYVTLGKGGLFPLINNPTLTSSSYRHEVKGTVVGQSQVGRCWKVRALVNGIWTDWSEERTFEVDPVGDSLPVRTKPEDAEAHWRRGAALHKHNKLDEAVTELREAVRLQKDLLAAHQVLAQIYSQQNKPDEAAAAYREVIKLEPKNSAARQILGDILRRQKKLDEAVTCYKEAIKHDPKAVWAYVALGFTLGDQKKLDEAIAAHEQALRLQSNFAEAHFALASALAQAKEWDRSATVYAEALKRFGAQLWPGPWYEAIRSDEVFTRLTALRPDDRLPWIMRTRLHTLQRDWKRAAADYARINESVASIDQAKLLLEADDLVGYACLVLLLGDHPGYEQFCKKWADRVGDSKGWEYSLARAWAVSPRSVVPAQQIVERARESMQARRDPWKLHVLSLAHYRNGEFDLAIECAKESNAGNWRGSAKGLNWLVLAMAHSRLGHAAEARTSLEQARLLAGRPSPKQPPGVEWPDMAPPDFVEFELLRREADGLIDPKATEKPAKDRD